MKRTDHLIQTIATAQYHLDRIEESIRNIEKTYGVPLSDREKQTLKNIELRHVNTWEVAAHELAVESFSSRHTQYFHN